MRVLEMWVRSILFNMALFFWLFILPIFFVWVVLLDRLRVSRAVAAWQSQLTWFEKTVAGIDYKIVGAEHIPPGPCLIAAKHESAWETCKLHMLFGDPAIVLKKELTRVPIWGWFAKATGLIPVDRSGGAKAMVEMMKIARQAVQDGRKIVIFPQGTRVKPGVRKPYKVGVVGLYQELDLPVVPMALNSGLFWPKNSFLKKKGTITIEFLPPIPPGLSRSQMLRRLENDLETASDRLAGITPTA